MTQDDIRALSTSTSYTFGDGTEVKLRKVSIQALIDATEAIKRRIVQRAVAGLGAEATTAERIAVAQKVAFDVDKDGNSIDLETPEGLLAILSACAVDGVALPQVTLEEVPRLSEFVRSEMMGLPPEGSDPNVEAVTGAG